MHLESPTSSSDEGEGDVVLANGNNGKRRKLGSQLAGIPEAHSSTRWDEALKIVRREEANKRRLRGIDKFETYADTMRLPLTLLGLTDPDIMISHEKQLFRDKIARYFKEDTEQNHNFSSTSVNSAAGCSSSRAHQEKVCLDDPTVDSEIVGARRRKVRTTKLKFMDRHSSKPFGDLSLYNVTARKTTASGLEFHRIEWFQNAQPSLALNGDAS